MAQNRRKNQPTQAERRGRTSAANDDGIEVIVVDRDPSQQTTPDNAFRDGLGACVFFLALILAAFSLLAALATFASALWASFSELLAAPSALALLQIVAASYAFHDTFCSLRSFADALPTDSRPAEQTTTAAYAGAACSGHLSRAAFVAAVGCRAAQSLSGGLPDAATRSFGTLAICLAFLAALSGLLTVGAAGSWVGAAILLAVALVAWFCAAGGAIVRFLLPREGLVVAAVAAGLGCALMARALARDRPKMRRSRFEVYVRRTR
jgi:hypothetical protein